MNPHPSTFVASAEEHRQDLLAVAARERLSATVPAQTPRAPALLPLWRLATHVVQITHLGFSVQPRPHLWTHA